MTNESIYCVVVGGNLDTNGKIVGGRIHKTNEKYAHGLIAMCGGVNLAHHRMKLVPQWEHITCKLCLKKKRNK